MRNIVTRVDGRRVHVPRARGHLFVCADGCCCGRTESGFPPVPRDAFHEEWERRRLRSRVHLTIGGCLGPCALANVVMFLFEGRQAFFHSINGEAPVHALYDWIETLLEAEGWVAPPHDLARHHFTGSTWEARPDGHLVDDRHLRPERARPAPGPLACPTPSLPPSPDAVVANMSGREAAPRKNGELVFQAPWEGRIFGMAVALHHGGLYGWKDFQQSLIARIAAAEALGEPSGYYERWLASFETLLAERGLVTPEELAERTEEFELGERDEVY
jgi:cobaltochelatase CobN